MSDLVTIWLSSGAVFKGGEQIGVTNRHDEKSPWVEVSIEGRGNFAIHKDYILGVYDHLSSIETLGKNKVF